jgi:hypothetical protein
VAEVHSVIEGPRDRGPERQIEIQVQTDRGRDAERRRYKAGVTDGYRRAERQR